MVRNCQNVKESKYSKRNSQQRENAVKVDVTCKINEFTHKLVEGAIDLTKYRHLQNCIHSRPQPLRSLGVP